MSQRTIMAVSALVLFSGLGSVQSRADIVTEFQDWALVCSDAECRLAQTLMSRDRIWIATVMLHPDNHGEQARMADVLVPTGAHFPSGLFVTAGPRSPQRAEWIRCTDRACESLLRLDAKTEAQWKKGAVAEIRFRPSPAAPVATADISLMGVSAGLAALDAQAKGAGG